MLPSGGYKYIKKNPKATLLLGELICLENFSNAQGNWVFGQDEQHFH